MSGPLLDGPLTSILDTTIDGVFVIDDAGIVQWVNNAAARMFGWPAGELLGRNISVIVPSPEKERHDRHLAGFDPNRPLSHVLGVGRWLEAERRNGSRFPVEVGLAHFTRDGRRYFAGFVRDVSERHAAQEKMAFLATHDPLTKLPNDRLLVEALEAALHRGETPALIVLTVSGLGRIGEHHGRGAAEHVLRVAAARLTREAGGPVYFAHLDGEIFGVITDEKDSEDLARVLCATVCRPVMWGSVDLVLSAVAGVVHARDLPAGTEAMTRAAHAAARYAALRGGDNVARYTEVLGQRIERDLKMEERLRAAVAKGQLTLALQPKVRASDGVIVGAEALARWHDPTLGQVPPAEFIPVAERSGIIGDLGAWMLRQALSEAASWRIRGWPLVVAVNISAIDLHQPDLVAKIASALLEANCSPSCLEIELTESALIDDPDQAKRQLRAIKDLGVSLALDDFGTGYSSLSYLRHLPIDALKIDQSFVRDMPEVTDAVAVARTVVALARSLGMVTIAEGVETEAQASSLRALGVDILQGYLYGRPLAPKQFRESVAQSVE